MPNTVGMSQFADGGKLATKPYESSAAYIDRMSNYCQGCHFDKKARVGARANPFNALYWDFFCAQWRTLVCQPKAGDSLSPARQNESGGLGLGARQCRCNPAHSGTKQLA